MIIRYLALPLFVSFCWLSGVAGCKESTGSGGNGGGGTHNPPAGCSSDADCAGGDICYQGFCYETSGSQCTSDTDCAAGDVCDTASGQCLNGGLACTSDADCAADEFCDAASGFCFVASGGCASDADCAAGDICNLDTGLCEGGSSGCTSDADCAAGEVCNVDTGLCETGGGSCFTCACTALMSEGGCADLCDGDQNGTGTPNFCNGVGALPQCADCIATTCGADPSTCN